jgi:hypothetical protein
MRVLSWASVYDLMIFDCGYGVHAVQSGNGYRTSREKNRAMASKVLCWARNEWAELCTLPLLGPRDDEQARDVRLTLVE